MKTPSMLLASLMLIASVAQGQGTFIYDQQSSTDESAHWGTGGAIQQIAKPFGQSFTPGLASVDFVRLKLYDNDTNNALGATLFVNLRAGSISGNILSSTTPVFIPNGAGGVMDFLFPAPVALTPGSVYFLEPVVQSGDLWLIDANEYNYAGGSVFAGGLPVPGSDLWFREGAIVPEPLPRTLYVVAAVLLTVIRRLRLRR